MLHEIQQLVRPYGVNPETLARAYEEALLEAGKSADSRSRLLGSVLWKIFTQDGPLWIDEQTAAGNVVVADLLVAGYAIWNDAVIYAENHGADAFDAAEALVQATHATADKIARHKLNPENEGILDLRKYVFASYMRLISNIARKQLSGIIDYIDTDTSLDNRELSDRGDFLDGLENGIYCKELLDAMPYKGKSVASLRYIFGCSWQETAEALNTSVNAAQKALSAGMKQASERTCMRELPGVGSKEIARLRAKKNRISFRGKIRYSDADKKNRLPTLK
jgi:DNA-directed RNA polymerase specialized sigma24 family protein